ncbi:hypothetical protein [Undibacterium sp. Di24W]|uniref:hypothetical protein n=1 Tax=Undibacterium sp. Di24W TaxID=3413033 RepID=UPI003BF0BB2B
MNTQSSGYSGASLAKKLGLTENCEVCALHAPNDYLELLAPIPSGVLFKVKPDSSTDIVHVFAEQKIPLHAELIALRSAIKTKGVI